MRIVICDPKSGKSFQVELPKEQDAAVIGKRIGDKIDGGLVGAAGYTLELAGGSDGSGFPMRADIPGNRKISVLVTKGTGFHSKRKGERRRKMLRGNTYSQDTVQVNAKVVEAGPAPLGQLLGKEDQKPEKTESPATKEGKKD